MTLLNTVAFFLCMTAAGEPSVVAPSVDPEASCANCHADIVALRAPGEDVHNDLACDECHPGRVFNPHAASDMDAEERLQAEAYTSHAKASPMAWTLCEECHDEVAATWRASVHGLRDAVPAGADGVAPPEYVRPSCGACHGNIHAVQEGMSANKRVMAARCIACHGFDDTAQAGVVPTSPHVVETFQETIHGKMLRLGNEEAAGCSDCHTGHGVFGVTDVRSSIHESNRAETCRACHSDATGSFAAAISHTPHAIDEDFWGWVTALGFSLLTVGVIFLLFVHITLDFLRAAQLALARRRQSVEEMTNVDSHAGETDDASGAPLADAALPRFDIHARLQHWGMMISFILLVATGWPLKAASMGESGAIAMMVGGQHVLALIHRGAGILMLVVTVYHLGYLLWQFKRGELDWSMVPMLKDAKDLLGNLSYMLGLTSRRPKYGKWTYYEKFDYWAVFWGMLIMGGSGLILWFPALTAKILPGQFISLAMIGHSDEALLAALAIFLWHFYNVHLRPSVFPMSWVWLTGNISAEAAYEEHRAVYEQEFGVAAPRSTVNSHTWHSQSRWSILSLLVVLIAGAVVVVGDVASVRARVEALSAGRHYRAATSVVSEAAAAALHEAEAVALGSAFGDEFEPFSKCFGCHNKERFATGAAGFPHDMHFEENDVSPDCGACHKVRWHRDNTLDTEICSECHDDLAELGLPGAGDSEEASQ